MQGKVGILKKNKCPACGEPVLVAGELLQECSDRAHGLGTAYVLVMPYHLHRVGEFGRLIQHSSGDGWGALAPDVSDGEHAGNW